MLRVAPKGWAIWDIHITKMAAPLRRVDKQTTTKMETSQRLQAATDLRLTGLKGWAVRDINKIK